MVRDAIRSVAARAVCPRRRRAEMWAAVYSGTVGTDGDGERRG